MTEAEWLASDDPIVMLGGVPYRWDRKFRMFACAYARSIWKNIRDRDAKKLVRYCESEIVDPLNKDQHYEWMVERAKNSVDGANANAAIYGWVFWWAAEVNGKPRNAEFACHLLRDIFGNEFRPATIEPTGLRPRSSALPKEFTPPVRSTACRSWRMH